LQNTGIGAALDVRTTETKTLFGAGQNDLHSNETMELADSGNSKNIDVWFSKFGRDYHVKLPIEKTQETKTAVEINLKDFSETNSKQLLRDLIACPSGVPYKENNHGKDQPKAIKKMLKVKYPEVASDIHTSKGRIYLKKFALKEKNNLP